MLDKLICFQKAANKNLTPYLSEKISKLTNILYMDFSDMMATKFLVSSSLNAFSTSQKQIEKFSFLKNSLCLVTFLCLSRICILIMDFFFSPVHQQLLFGEYLLILDGLFKCHPFYGNLFRFKVLNPTFQG